MSEKETNIAYIDAANLHKGVGALGWKLNYSHFRVWLREKYGVKEAYLFIGFISKNKDLYTNLQEAGFVLVFKEVVYDGMGKAKGNCDADLVLRVTQDAYEKKFEKAIIVSSDGDYASLVKFLSARNQLRVVLSPAEEKRCSILLKKLNIPITYINDVKSYIKA